MAEILLDNLKTNEVYPLLIKYKNTLYYTGYYYDENGNDCLFNDLKNIICFKTTNELTDFCSQNNLPLNGDLAEYDFDLTPANPIDYKDILHKWNLLDTASSVLNIVFEGNDDKYTDVYNYLFSCNFALTPLPTLYLIPDDYFELIKNVFNNQTKILEKIKYFTV